MRIRKYAVIAVISLIFACFNLGANAAEPRARYLVEGNFDAEQKTYTVEIHLETDTYLAAGTFGMEYNENVTIPNVNINTEYFERLDTKLFKDNATTFPDNHQLVFQWGMNNTEITELTKIKLASFKIENVSIETAKSWGETPFTLLDWSTTNLAETDVFKEKDETDGYGKSLNDEIWRAEESGTPVGYYQGYAYNEGEWIDIDFKFTSNLNNEIKIVGTVSAYNPKNDIEVTAYNADGEYKGEITGCVIYPDGRITYTYEIRIKEAGDYMLVIQKSAHLTYSAQTTVPENTDEHSVGVVTLICGDINGDGYVKYPDRAELIRFLNKQRTWTENVPLFNRADLNGDELVNLFDLNILKANLDKTY